MSCEICKSHFSWFRKKETLCKRCFRTICTTCSSNQQTVQNSTLLYLNICKHCQEDITFIRRTIQQNMCSWNHNSLIVKNWVPDLENARANFPIINDDTIKKQIIKEFKNMSINYSLQEFFYYLWRSFQPQQIENAVASVILAFIHRNPTIGFNQYVIKIVAYLLCFAKDFAVLKILEDLYNKIPQQFHPKYQQSAEFIVDSEWMISDAIQDLKCRFKLEQHQILMAKQFIEGTMTHYKNQLYLNLSFPCCYFIMNQIILNDVQEIDKYFSAIVNINLNSLNKNNSEQIITRSTFLKDLQNIATINIERSSLYCHTSIDMKGSTSSPIKIRKNHHNLTTIIRNVSDFDSEILEDQSTTPSIVKLQQNEIIKLTNELYNLDQQIGQLKIENSQLEDMIEIDQQKTNEQLFQEHNELFTELISDAEQLLKLCMKD